MVTSLEKAKNNLANVNKWQDSILKHSKTYNLPSAIVAAIISRETMGLDKWCLPPPKGRLGDNGHGCGPMQIDDRSFPEWCAQWKAGLLTTDEGIRKGCEVLEAKRKAVASLKVPFIITTVLYAAVAAYNCGAGNVSKAVKKNLPVDFYTTGKDYASDVFAQSVHFKANGYYL